MSLLLAEIVDTDALLEMLWTAALAGFGVTAAYGIAIAGGIRALDLGRSGRTAEALLLGIVGAVGLAVVIGAIVFGVIVMVNK
ncbi:MAG TPA: hypothetical protein VGF25_23525 [Thermoleophilaceae bacterium]|jgi:hypothetical protein